MNGRTVVAAVVGAIVMFALGFVFYGLLLEAYMRENVVEYAGLMKNPPNFVALGLHNLVFAWLISFIFDKWADIRTFAGGFIGGALIMFAVALATDLGFLAFMNIFKGLTIVVVDVAVVTIMGGITGGVIAEILGRMGHEPATA